MRYYVRTRCFGATHKFIARKRNDLATRGEESGMAITIRRQREEKERERERALFSAWNRRHPLLRRGVK